MKDTNEMKIYVAWILKTKIERYIRDEMKEGHD